MEPPHRVETPTEAIDRLLLVLEATGGSMDDDDDEPGVSPRTRAIEDALKQVIRYLQAIAVWLIAIETATHALFLPRIWAIS